MLNELYREGRFCWQVQCSHLLKIITLQSVTKKHFRFSSNYEAYVSESLENIEMFPQ